MENKELRQLIRILSRPLNPIPVYISEQQCPGTNLSDSGLSPRAVIFDVYGTILISAAGDIGHDAAQDSERAFWEAAKDAGISESDRLLAEARVKSGIRVTEILRHLITLDHEEKKSAGIQYPEVDIVEIWQKVLEELGYKDVDRKKVRYLALGYELRVNPVWPMPGLKETLFSLQQKGLCLGIISNAQFYTPLILEALLNTSLSEAGFRDDLCIWSFQEARGKPDRLLFEKMQRRLLKYSISPQEVIYVGNDMLKDIWPAAQVGWKTALFAGDKRSIRLRDTDERIAGLKPDVIISDLKEICRFCNCVF